ncbi:MAG: FAD-dependent oxidoreductase [Hyphomicrobiaceae bacterium]
MDLGRNPMLKNVVLVGAGHAHVGALRSFGLTPDRGVRLTLISRQAKTPYSGMLPGLVAGHYGFDDIHIDIDPLADFAGAQFHQAEVTGLDLSARRVICDGCSPLPFDILSIDTGSTPGGSVIPGVARHAIAVKPIDQFIERFEAARVRVLAARGNVRIGVVGGGAAGIELALSLDSRLRRDLEAAGSDGRALRVAVLTMGAGIVPALPAGAQRRLARILSERGIEVIANARVIGVDGGQVAIEGGAVQDIDELFWTTEAAAAAWLADTGLALDAAGFVAVDDTLQSVSHAGVFAAGDVASMRGRNLPKSGVYAVRQGPYLADNIRRAAAGRRLVPYRPQGQALYLISTGDRYAVGTRNGLSFEGAWVWRWKDWIDRRFMRTYKELPGVIKPSRRGAA